jgi:hypothetical protein
LYTHIEHYSPVWLWQAKVPLAGNLSSQHLIMN